MKWDEKDEDGVPLWVRAWEKGNYITDGDVSQYWSTHDFTTGELPICRRCGLSPIALGMWGDNEWRLAHRGWESPCQGIAEVMDGAG